MKFKRKDILRLIIYIFFISSFLLAQLTLISSSWAQTVNEDNSGEVKDSPTKVVINNIFIIGNEKTKKSIILREIDLQPGITYDWEELVTTIQADQKKIYNLQLFNNVEITPLLTDNERIELLVTVTERWYILPNIIFNLADRNIAEWWTNQNRDFSRVNYGARLLHNNVGGRNAKLRAGAQFGFTQAYELAYSTPYIDRKQRHGLAAQMTYFTQKTISIRSSENRQIFFTNPNENILRRNFNGFLRYTFRGSYYNFHFVSLGVNNTQVHPDVLVQNRNYFLHETNNLRYTFLSYSFRHDRRDNIAYATQGQLLNVTLNQYGLLESDDFKDTEFSINANKYLKFTDRIHLASGISFNAFLGKRQPFTLVRGIGYNPYFIRGYELNVIEGQRTIVHKNSLRLNLLNKNYDIGQYVPLEEFAYLPFKIYLSGNFDHGFVNDLNNLPENMRLTNRYLFGYGLGLDLVTLYDMVFRFEYSRNNMAEGGFFINFRAPF
jgi:outer membrane protein assembly factor BamA